MKLLYFPLLLLYLMPSTAADPIDKVAALIRQGDTKELSKLFAATVEITILEEENVYSKTQAELILDKFFSENKPASVKILHKVNTNPNYLFGVLTLTAGNGTYRVTYTLKKGDSGLTLIELRIEAEKAK